MAQKNKGVELVLVSDANATETQAWLDMVRSKDGVEVHFPVLVTPGDAQFIKVYNPTGSVPYFCLVDEHGLVQARSLFVESDWPKVRRSWEGTTELAPWMTHRH